LFTVKLAGPGRGKELGLLAAQALADKDALWKSTSARDVVTLCGDPVVSILGIGAEAGAEQDLNEVLAAAAAGGGGAAAAEVQVQAEQRGTKRGREEAVPSKAREYLCGFCKQVGHRIAACADLREGRAPHPTARAAALRRVGYSR